MMEISVGVDACRAGWFAVILQDAPPDDEPAWRFGLHTHVSTLWADYEHKADTILIDIPIGLPEEGQRACDVLAREQLKRRFATVFMTPTRAAVYAVTYADACDQNLIFAGKKISHQAWNITPKIREVDAFLRDTPQAVLTLRESHPELMFSALNGGTPLTSRKKSAEGQAQRLELLRAHVPTVDGLLAEVYATHKRGDVGVDDVLDALALAVGARAQNWLTLPPIDPPLRDAYGLPMQIITAAAFAYHMNPLITGNDSYVEGVRGA